MLKGAWLVVLHHDEQIRIYEFRATAWDHLGGGFFGAIAAGMA